MFFQRIPSWFVFHNNSHIISDDIFALLRLMNYLSASLMFIVNNDSIFDHWSLFDMMNFIMVEIECKFGDLF
jgi:hypothetical protein